jgi:hypothetical protein
MKIEINYVPQDDQYCAQICDGPEGIEEESFVCSSLGELFEKIIVWRTLIALSYCEATEND